jgi:hypothetical protein
VQPRDCATISSEIAIRVRDAIGALRARGCTRVGILGGSIAGYGLLRNLDVVNGCSALMLLSPVHFMNQTTAARLGCDRGDTITDAALELATRATRLSTPIAIVHGIQDELSPAYYSSVFMSAVGDSVPKLHVPVEDEGHVFSSFASWQRVVDVFLAFAREHLVESHEAFRGTHPGGPRVATINSLPAT